MSRPATGPGFGVEPGDSVVRGAGRSGIGVGNGGVEEPSALVEGAGIPVVSPERPPPGPLLVCWLSVTDTPSFPPGTGGAIESPFLPSVSGTGRE
ncbi:hypothetical protein [Streptomyces sp. NPDC006645]|uniref:hypothetical protein n=1 Tax=unclassified Streptomyces TaxID=2593676 RepID=UPI00339E4483